MPLTTPLHTSQCVKIHGYDSILTIERAENNPRVFYDWNRCGGSIQSPKYFSGNVEHMDVHEVAIWLASPDEIPSEIDAIKAQIRDTIAKFKTIV